MKKIKNSLLSEVALFSILLMLISCNSMKNLHRPMPKDFEEGSFITQGDGIKICVHDYVPASDFKSKINFISGITGINRKNGKDIIEELSNNENCVVVTHARGTGYSVGKRGDNSDLSDFIGDYVDITKSDKYSHNSNRKLFLFGHSLSCAIAIKAAGEMQKTDGIILVNPPYKLKPDKGMTPGVKDYLRNIGYYIFGPYINRI
jgi:alpha-beta hydrolase superfamily lysophospholipase